MTKLTISLSQKCWAVKYFKAFRQKMNVTNLYHYCSLSFYRAQISASVQNTLLSQDPIIP